MRFPGPYGVALHRWDSLVLQPPPARRILFRWINHRLEKSPYPSIFRVRWSIRGGTAPHRAILFQTTVRASEAILVWDEKANKLCRNNCRTFCIELGGVSDTSERSHEHVASACRRQDAQSPRQTCRLHHVTQWSAQRPVLESDNWISLQENSMISTAFYSTCGYTKAMNDQSHQYHWYNSFKRSCQQVSAYDQRSFESERRQSADGHTMDYQRASVSDHPRDSPSA